MDEHELIRQLPDFRDLPGAALDRLCETATVQDQGAGQLVFSENGLTERIHYLLDGSIELLVAGKVAQTFSADANNPGRPLDPTLPRTCSARTPSGATIAWFERDALETLVERSPDRGLTETQGDAQRDKLSDTQGNLARSDWMVRMLQSDVFSNLAPTNVQRVFAALEPVEYQAEQVVVNQGSMGDYYFVVESGYCEVTRAISAGRGQIHLANLGPGDTFGEEALITNRPRNATVTMVSSGRLMRLGKRDFKALIQDTLLHGLTLEDALAEQRSRQAIWLDVRRAEEFRKRCLNGSENIPQSVIRPHSERLNRDQRYIVCAPDVDDGAIAAFLLSARGFDVAYLTVTIDTLFERLSDQLTTADEMQPATVVFLHEQMESTTPPAAGNDKTHDADDEALDLSDTIARIATLSTHAEAKREMQNLPELDRLAQTAGGKALAELLTELAGQHDTLNNENNDDSRLDGVEVLDITAAPGDEPPVSEDQPPNDLEHLLDPLIDEFTNRTRAVFEQTVAEQIERLENDYKHKLEQARESLQQASKTKEAAIQRQLIKRYKQKEQLLRSNYKKVVAYANRLSHQKQRLKQAQQKLAQRMAAADRMYKEIKEMRALMGTEAKDTDADSKSSNDSA